MTNEAAHALSLAIADLADATRRSIDAYTKGLEAQVLANHRLSLLEANISVSLAQQTGEIERAERARIRDGLRGIQIRVVRIPGSSNEVEVVFFSDLRAALDSILPEEP